MCNINLPKTFISEYLNTVTLISSLSVLELNFGNRCLGQGISLNSCGDEYKKLKTCGIKKRSVVLLKCPKMPTTANVIPEK